MKTGTFRTVGRRLLPFVIAALMTMSFLAQTAFACNGATGGC